jgi:site-specific recombinase XerD
MNTTETHKYQLNQINLYGGDVKLFTTKDSNGIWYVKIWIHEEEKYYQKSLRTRDENYARSLAENEYVLIKAKRLNKQQIFSQTLHQVIDEWLEEIKKGVGISRTEGRYKVIVSQTNWLKKFISDKTIKIQDIDGQIFSTYFIWRKKKRENVVNSTLMNEASMVRTIFSFAIQRGYLQQGFNAEFQHLKKENNRREALSVSEWRTITNHLKSKKFLNDGDTNKTRHFVRDFAVLMCNTGCRFKEMRLLKWKNVKVVRGKDENKVLCEIHFDDWMTKNGKERTVQGMRGDILERIKKYSNYTHHNDYIFVDNNSGNKLKRDVYYRAWKVMMKETGLDKGWKKITYYNLRHTYATFRQYAGVDSRSLCENLGCGLRFLEEHYGHLQTKVMRDRLTKDIDDDIKYLLEE